jgi:formamidopyrimidine-DNA glycosylase
MPELPEVETTVRQIRPHVVGRRIVDVEVDWRPALGGVSMHRFRGNVVGSRIAGVWRRAKYLVFDLDGAGCLVGHLRMTGRLRVLGPAEDPGPYSRLRLALSGGRVLHFLDLRKFGRLVHARRPDEILAGLGPEPLGTGFTSAWLRSALRRRRRQLKPLLLDQSFVAGLGNIYVDEALHRARLHPCRPAHRVRAASADRLHRSIRQVLEAAIELQGSTFDGFYETPEGNPGRYQHEFRVYGRVGRPCPRCGRPIRRIVVAQRGTHLCPRCQPAPRAT